MPKAELVVSVKVKIPSPQQPSEEGGQSPACGSGCIPKQGASRAGLPQAGGTWSTQSELTSSSTKAIVAVVTLTLSTAKEAVADVTLVSAKRHLNAPHSTLRVERLPPWLSTLCDSWSQIIQKLKFT
jgi:hypothetical protein